MNPFTVNRIIKNSDMRYSVAGLSKLCGVQIHHADLKMSSALELFHCPYTDCACHFAKGVSISGWFRLWFRK